MHAAGGLDLKEEVASAGGGAVRRNVDAVADGGVVRTAELCFLRGAYAGWKKSRSAPVMGRGNRQDVPSPKTAATMPFLIAVVGEK